jgi:hypothetical protein
MSLKAYFPYDSYIPAAGSETIYMQQLWWLEEQFETDIIFTN